MLKNDGSWPMHARFIDIVDKLKLFIQNIRYVINGLLQTLAFIHNHNILHNNLHGKNILLHSS